MSSKLEDGGEIARDRGIASLRLTESNHRVGEFRCRLRGSQNQSCHQFLSVRPGALGVRELNEPVEPLIQGTRESDRDRPLLA
jgi:hypothetical protein